ncbi:metal-dependent hydrolase [Marinobacteraceae bacterium S3BR75-40.1]
MDSVTQIALGAAVGGAVMGRRLGWKAFAWGGVVGTLPDLDALVDYGSAVADFTYHRGYTHSLVVHTLVAPLFAAGLRRLHPNVSFKRWWLAVWLILITHALLDTFTIYGTQLLLPFTDYPFGLGSIFIIDPLYTVPLIIGCTAALTLRSQWARARRWNTAGLVVSSLYLVWTLIGQQWALNRAEAAVARTNLPAERVLVTPTPLNSILWRIVAVGEQAHWEGFYTLGSERPITLHRYPNHTNLLNDLEDRWAVRRLQRFTKGFYSVTEQQGKVVITDLRMGQYGFYVFAFTVGQAREGHIEAIHNHRFRYNRPDIAIIVDELLACGYGEPTRVIAC